MEALVAVFTNGPHELTTIVKEYPAVATKVTINPSLEELARQAVAFASELGESMLESLVRRARRERSGRPELAEVICDLWPFAGDITFTQIDELRAVISALPNAVKVVREYINALNLAVEPPLWKKQGADELGDLLEGLAQRDGSPLPLLHLAATLGDKNVHASLDVSGTPSSRDGREGLIQGARRLVLVLHQVENDDHLGEVWICDAAGRPRFVADIPRGTLAEMPQRFADALNEGGRLLSTVAASDLDQIDVVLPVASMLSVIESWQLFGEDPIGSDFSVTVRPLERGHPARYPAFLQGHMLVKKARKALNAGPVKRWIELDRVDDELRRHPDDWCIAEFCCLDAGRAERAKALARLIHKGVAAMIAPRHGGKQTAIPAGPTLPALVRTHRKTCPDQPVMLLWDADDLKLERKP